MKQSKFILAFSMTCASLFGSMAFGSINLTLGCKVQTESERGIDISNPTITFDAEKGYANLQIEVYGSEVFVGTTYYMSADGKTCGDKVEQICVSLKDSGFCTNQPEATLYPTTDAQPGDRTTISCSLTGDTVRPCNLK